MAEESGPRTVLRVMDILMTLAQHPAGRTLSELTHDLALPKTSLFSLLRTLERGGFLANDRDGRHVLGPKSLALGAAIVQHSDFPSCTRPVLDRLARETGETVMLAVPTEEGVDVSYAEVIESEAPLRFTVRPGNRRPLYCAAAGKMILAYLPEAEQKDYLARTEFVKFTTETFSKAEVARLLPRIRERGVVSDINGMIDGASGIASPAFDPAGNIRCSVAIAGPTTRILAEQERLEKIVNDAGLQISRILGYLGPYPSPEAPAQPIDRR